MANQLYKVVSLLVSVLGSMLATTVFKKVWKLAAGDTRRRRAAGRPVRRDQGRDGPRRRTRHPAADRHLARGRREQAESEGRIGSDPGQRKAAVPQLLIPPVRRRRTSSQPATPLAGIRC